MPIIADEIDFHRLGLLILARLVYFALHSLLASFGLKRLVAREHPQWLSACRLAYNTLAVLMLVPPLALTYMDRGPWLWEWTGIGWWLANGLAALAVLRLLWSLRWHDGSDFLGLRQWREKVRAAEDQERFHLSPLHRFVRHPWCSLGLVIIWTREMDRAFRFSILAHPTGRLIAEREPYDLDMARIIRHARDRGCFLELNAHPERLDLTDTHCQMAWEEEGATINSDAHNRLDFANLIYGVGQAPAAGWKPRKCSIHADFACSSHCRAKRCEERLPTPPAI